MKKLNAKINMFLVTKNYFVKKENKLTFELLIRNQILC